MENFKKFNAHPDGKIVKDCVKRAIATALNKDYKVVALELNRLKKTIGVKKFNSNENWRTYLEENKDTLISFPAKAGHPRMNGHTFAQQFSKGRYVLRMAKHLSCCIDGVIYDTWDCRDRCVYQAYKVEENKNENKRLSRLL